MILDCGNCGARYNIQDSLIPPQGARVKCKKCATLITIPPPPLTELAPQDLELIPPSPESPAAPVPATDSDQDPVSSGFDAPSAAAEKPSARSPESEMPLEHFPQEPPPEAPAAEDEFERAGAPARFGSPPSFTDASTPSMAGYGSTMTVESPVAPPSPVAVAREEQPVVDEAPQTAEVGQGKAAEAAAPAPEAVSTSPAPTGTPLPEGLSPVERSAHEKARRLARVLASDIAIYNRDKKERGMREGNLVAMLGYEIKKSWEIYKERVGSEFANSTPYFRDALNDMLADGKKIF